MNEQTAETWQSLNELSNAHTLARTVCVEIHDNRLSYFNRCNSGPVITTSHFVHTRSHTERVLGMFDKHIDHIRYTWSARDSMRCILYGVSVVCCDCIPAYIRMSAHAYTIHTHKLGRLTHMHARWYTLTDTSTCISRFIPYMCIHVPLLYEFRLTSILIG